MPKLRRASLALALAVVVATAGAACGSSATNSSFHPGGDDASTVDGALDGSGLLDTGSGIPEGGLIQGDGDGGGGGNGDAALAFDVEPSALQTIKVTAGQTTPQVIYKATLGGSPISAAWSVDRGDLASIATGPSATGTFTPTGTTGGLVNVVAGLNGKTIQRQVFIELTSTQNGSTAGEASQVPTTVAALGAGGGVGGVGGEGLGGPAAPGDVTALKNPTGNGQAQGLTFLYPYNQTVFPRGLLAPLLQWTWTTNDADAILITLATTSGSFTWSGTFGRPPILATTMGPFIRSPIPQDVWTMATNTAGGPTPNGKPDQLTMTLTVAKGGVAYGPISETWSVAAAHLEGTVYYNSYGTQLVQNSLDLDFNGKQYGAAVLGIDEGSTGPTVVAGPASGLSGTGCRVCHVVASGGSLLIAQHGDDYYETSTIDLKNANAETVLTNYDSTFGWSGLSADGTLALTNAADLAAGNPPSSQLYAFPPAASGATPLSAIGIPSNLQAGAPTFSPDTKHVAFEFLGGTIGTTTGNPNASTLVSLDFDRTTNSFSNLTVLATMPGSDRAGFPSFFPTNDAVAFHYQIVNSNHRYNTWHGAEAQIWWSDLATGTATELYALNGNAAGGATSYLPTGPNNHGNDTVLNYEPTVNPVSSGGYIWVIFTSRRLYGNVATTDPWQSDPRSYDDTKVANTTTKKLWVAAIDLNAKPGTDPSHPAFYLPAQELLAGNARGFWVLPPCEADGMSCTSGDQCCNGYCEAGGDGGSLICTNTPPNTMCSALGDKCTTSASCCDTSNVCINGFCSVSGPQ
jgi:hypothetical protein